MCTDVQRRQTQRLILVRTLDSTPGRPRGPPGSVPIGDASEHCDVTGSEYDLSGIVERTQSYVTLYSGWFTVRCTPQLAQSSRVTQYALV